MFGTGRQARAAYRDVALASRLDGASPHRLIAILYEEFDTALATMIAAARAGDQGRLLAGRARALTILGGLEAGLDRDKGGEIAGGLAAVYREARRRLRDGANANDPQWIEQARAMIAEIADAWRQIA